MENIMHNSNPSNPITWIRDSHGFVKVATAVKLFFFLSTFYFVPSAQAVEQAVKAEQAKQAFHPQGRSDEEKLSNTLQAIKEHVAERKAQLSQRVSKESSLWEDFLNLFGASSLLAEDLDRLQSMAEAAEQLHQKTLAGFAKTEQDLKAKGLPEVILQRHTETVNKYHAQYQQSREKLGQTLQAESLQDQDTALGELDEFLGEQQFKRTQQPFDPNNLPFGTPDPDKTRKPVTDPQQLNELLGLTTQPGTLENLVNGVISPAYAQTGNQPGPADLEPTIDVQITDAITELANQLNNNPVEIYNWVRNNIEFMPTYGSIQGGDMALQTKRGNAFDTSSLLIALLRSSGIPARYAYGVVRIPADQVMNWVGGVEVPEAALSLLGQGGIPARGLAQGGKITHIEMEHIWVEAWVDFFPSRGFKNIEGDSWIPMDASFKQYEYSEGIDIQDQINADAESFAQQLVDSITMDASQGVIENHDRSLIQSQLNEFQAQAEQFIEQNHPTATASDIVGSKKIISLQPPVLAAGLPYRLQNVSVHYPALPDNLRHKYRLEVQDFYGNIVVDEILNLPSVAGRKLALNFVLASDTDRETFLSFFPEDTDSQEDLPQTLPGYLINVTAEISHDGETIKRGGTFPMGSELKLVQGLYKPGSGWRDTSSNIVAGEYHAIVVDAGAWSPVQISELRASLDQTRSRLEEYLRTEDPAEITGVSGHDLLGDLLQVGVLGWFVNYHNQSTVVARKMEVVNYGLPSYGKFGSSGKVMYSWGIPKSVSFSGLLMDLDFVNHIRVDQHNNSPQEIMFSQALGTLGSAFEHQIPEAILSTAENPAQGMSAVKALAIASAEGQKTYIINQNNIGQMENITIDAEAESEIRNAINAGHQVTVHESPLNRFGWQGSGYIILDPATGSGAYKISGGANGNFVDGGPLMNFLTHYAIEKFGALSKLIIGALRLFAGVSIFVNASKLIEECGGIAAFAVAGLLEAADWLFTTIAIAAALAATTLIAGFVLVIGISLIINMMQAVFIDIAYNICRYS